MRKIRSYEDVVCPYSDLESHELESHCGMGDLQRLAAAEPLVPCL